MDERAQQWIEEKWTNADKRCPVCQHNGWTIGEAVEVRPYQGGNLIIGGGVVPLIPVVCTNCGNTLLFSAVVANAVPDTPTPAEADKDEADDSPQSET